MLKYHLESEVIMPSVIRAFVRSAFPAIANDVDDLLNHCPDLETDQLFIDTLTTILARDHIAFKQALPDTNGYQASRAMLYLSNTTERVDIYNVLRTYKYLMEQKIEQYPAADHDIRYKHGIAFLLRCAHAIQLLALRKAS